MFRNGPGMMLKKPAEHLLGLDALNRVLEAWSTVDEPATVFQRAMDLLGLRYRIDFGSADCIPRSGPVIVVSNHPFGGADALVLSHLLAGCRPDVRMMANHLLSRLEVLRPWLIAVDPFGRGSDSHHRNVGPLKRAFAHLREGGCLGLFPAGEVSAFSPDRGGVADKPWSPHVAGLVRRTGATVVPVCFSGHNSLLFQMAGLVHPLLRTALLPRELLRCQGKEFTIRVGKPIPASGIPASADERSVVEALRNRVELLGSHRAPTKPVRFHGWTPAKAERHIPQPTPLAPPVDPELLAAEVNALPASTRLAAQAGLEVRLASADDIPHVLREIGRLREVTFRKVGEGTGLARDLDGFDPHYRHLFLWNPTKREIAGAYRLGLSDELLAHRGCDGFYTRTLFRFDASFLRVLGPCLELGRSFVVPDYQRKPASLLLLWKGIGRFVADNPRYRILFGPVSISNDYSQVSRSLMVEFLRLRHRPAQLGRKVKPRHPFRAALRLRRAHARIAGGLKSIDEVSSLVAGMEPDGKGVPVLVRQYLKLNAVLLQFNVDPEFANALDGLVVVDLLSADGKAMTRYMGEEGWISFNRAHGRDSVARFSGDASDQSNRSEEIVTGAGWSRD